MWPFHRLKTAPTGPTTRELVQDALTRVQLIEDRLEERLDALSRQAARVEQANRRADGRELTRDSSAGDGSPERMTLWELSRSVNRVTP